MDVFCFVKQLMVIQKEDCWRGLGEKVVFSIGYQAFNKTIPIIILGNFISLNPHSNDKQGVRAIAKGTKEKGGTSIWMCPTMAPLEGPLCYRLAPRTIAYENTQQWMMLYVLQSTYWTCLCNFNWLWYLSCTVFSIM